MATSGSILTNKFNVNTNQCRLSWQRKNYSVDKNTSTISWKLEVMALNALGSTAFTVSQEWEVTIDEQTFSGKSNINLAGNSTVIVATGEKTIQHNIDGTKTFSYSLDKYVLDLTLSPSPASGTGTLDKLPGAKATVTSAPDFHDEENPTITYNNPQGNNVEYLEACIALQGADGGWHSTGADYRDIPKTGTSYTFELTEEERANLRKAVAWGNTVTVRFYIRTTLQGGDKVYSSIPKTLTLVNHAPILAPVIKDIGIESLKITGDETKIIKHYNAVNVDFRAEAKKEAILVSQSLTYGEKTVGTQAPTSYSTTVYSVETGTFICDVRDSRGNRSSATVEVDLIEYFYPTCIFEAKAPTTDGDMDISASGMFFNNYFGDAGVAKHNELTVKYRLKANNGEYGEQVTIPAEYITTDGNEYSVNYRISGLDYLNKYTIEFQVNDIVPTILARVTRYQTVKTIPVYDWSSEDFRHNTDVYMSAGKSLKGLTSEGEEYNIASTSEVGLPTVFLGDKEAEADTYLKGYNLYIDTENTVMINGREYGKNQVLWNGAYYMNASQKISLSSTISAQPHGIILVFSGYADGAAQNYNFNSFFIPKELVSLQAGVGHSFIMTGLNFNPISIKYLYIGDTHISGHAYNEITGTGNGITFNNKGFVLRYVIGV